MRSYAARLAALFGVAALAFADLVSQSTSWWGRWRNRRDRPAEP